MSTTAVTDVRSRSISSRALPWSDVPMPDGALAVEEARAHYQGTAGPSGHVRWVVNAWVTGKRRGKSGRKVGDYRTVWYLVTPDQHPDERAHWPVWLVAWLEKYHPDRVSSLVPAEPDPTGTYL